MKKVLLVNTKYRIQGGEDVNIVEELNFLQKNYEVEYLEYKNSDPIKVDDFFGIYKSSLDKSNKIFSDVLDRFQPNVVYIHNTWFRANLGIFKILQERNIKTILKIHNFRYDCTGSFLVSNHFEGKSFCEKCGQNKKKFQLFNKYFQDSYAKSLLVNRYGKEYLKILKSKNINLFVLNNFHRQNLIELGVNEKNITVFYNPIKFEKSINYNSSSNNVVYAGALSEQKGINELLNSWNNIQNNKLNLLIFGTGHLEEKLKKNNNSPNIKFLGYQQNSVVKNYILKSKAVITSTKMLEGQPRLLCEASNLGVPSIFPSTGGMEEYFPSEYPLSFEQYNYDDLNEKLKLLNNLSLMESLSVEVHKQIKSLLAPERLEEIFENIIN